MTETPILKYFRRLARAEWLWVSLYFLLMTLIMTFPLVLRMGESMVGRVGDNIYFVWMIGWVKKALFELHVNPFDVWFLNYPEGWSMARTEITPVMLLLALPFAFLGGETFGYNSAMLLTFILSGLGMYVWVRRMTASRSAGLIAGTLFAFVPYHFAHFLIGHLNLSGTQWFPLYFAGLFGVLDLQEGEEPKRFHSGAALLAGVMLGLTAWTSMYYFYMLFLLTAFLLACYLVFMNRARLRSIGFWKDLLVIASAAFPLVLVAAAPFLMLDQSGGMPDRDLELVRRLAVGSPSDFLLPSTDHFLWGQWVGENFNRDVWVENTLYIGAVALSLGLLAWSKRKQLAQKRLLTLMLAGGLFAFVLSLGVDLHWLEEPVRFTPPPFLKSVLHQESYPVILPGYFLFKYLPFYAKLRTFMRFGVFALAFLCAAAGIGAAWLLKRLAGRRRILVAAGILLLVFLDFYPGPYQEFARVEGRRVDAWLAGQPGSGAVIQFPFAIAEDQEHTYYTLIHNKPYVGGFFNAFPPPQYARIRPLLENFPDRQSMDLMDELGVKYVLVDMDYYPDDEALKAACEALGLKWFAQLDDQMVFYHD